MNFFQKKMFEWMWVTPDIKTVRIKVKDYCTYYTPQNKTLYDSINNLGYKIHEKLLTDLICEYLSDNKDVILDFNDIYYLKCNISNILSVVSESQNWRKVNEDRIKFAVEKSKYGYNLIDNYVPMWNIGIYEANKLLLDYYEYLEENKNELQ